MDKTENKYLVLFNARWDIDRYFIENVNTDEVKVASIYKLYKKDFKYKIAVLWLEKFKLPFQSLWYEDWKKAIENYDTIIVNALNLSWQILSYIKKKNPNVRLIVWYWDTVNEKNRLPEKYKAICEVWSFDERDCDKYGMHKNVQFYYPMNVESKEAFYDAMFVGQDKGRTQRLSEICDLLQKSGLTVYTYVQYNRKEKRYLGKEILKPIKYTEIIKLIDQSRCIIDIPKAGQTGMTMRVLESLFYAKKLITTDKNISKAEFYNPANIFIWDEPNEGELKKFFSLPVEPVSERILNKYTFDAWIKNFGFVKNFEKAVEAKVEKKR